MSRGRAIGAGVLAGILAAISMTLAMLILARFLGVATPPAIFGDRISVFIPADPFLALMGRVGGYNHLKQLGVSSVIVGQILFGGVGGALYGAITRGQSKTSITLTAFVWLPLAAFSIILWPVLGTHYFGLPIRSATVATLLGLFAAFVCFERICVSAFQFLTGLSHRSDYEFSPNVGRRALLLSGLGVLVAGGVAGLLRKLYSAATFGYDGLQYKGRIVEAITPNDRFYCVTKNVIDPQVNPALWQLEVSGLVRTPQTYRLDQLQALPSVVQETTLMCISNGLDAGLMSNARWKGVPMPTLLTTAIPAAGAAKVVLHGVDNYTDTIPLDVAMRPTTLIAYQMNGAPLPHRHGFPARAIVPGYFGEKHVKWITRIELGDSTAIGFYEAQGWGPNFIVPTRSRFDQPQHQAKFSLASIGNPIRVAGVAFAGDRGISRVEISFDNGRSWQETKLDYPGTKLTWALWSYDWHPEQASDHTLVVRATDGEGDVQKWEEERPFKSGATGFHKILIHITG